MQLWRALLLPASAPTSAGGEPVYAALRPLVGGPAFLPLHVQIAHEGVVVPTKAAAETKHDRGAPALLNTHDGLRAEGEGRTRAVGW